MHLTIKELQIIESDMLNHVDKISRKHNIPYYVRAGSLLGTIRHQGPIPWDADIDIEVPYVEYDRFVHTLNVNLPKQYKVLYQEKKSKYDRLFARITVKGESHKHLHINVFPMIKMSNKKDSQKQHMKRIKLNQEIFKLKKITFREIFKTQLSFIKKVLVTFAKPFVCLFPDKYFYNKRNKLHSKYELNENKFIVNPYTKYDLKSVFPISSYKQTLRMSYDYFKVNVPHAYDEILKQLYGDYTVTKIEVKNYKEQLFEIKSIKTKELVKNIKKVTK